MKSALKCEFGSLCWSSSGCLDPQEIASRPKVSAHRPVMHAKKECPGDQVLIHYSGQGDRITELTLSPNGTHSFTNTNLAEYGFIECCC
jgi:hypothetical protein